MVNSVIKKVDTTVFSIWGVLRLAHVPVLRLMLVGVWLGLLWASFHFFDHYRYSVTVDPAARAEGPHGQRTRAQLRQLASVGGAACKRRSRPEGATFEKDKDFLLQLRSSVFPYMLPTAP